MSNKRFETGELTLDDKAIEAVVKGEAALAERQRFVLASASKLPGAPPGDALPRAALVEPPHPPSEAVHVAPPQAHVVPVRESTPEPPPTRATAPILLGLLALLMLLGGAAVWWQTRPSIATDKPKERATETSQRLEEPSLRPSAPPAPSVSAASAAPSASASVVSHPPIVATANKEQSPHASHSADPVEPTHSATPKPIPSTDRYFP